MGNGFPRQRTWRPASLSGCCCRLPEFGWRTGSKSLEMPHEKFEGERTLMRIHLGESDKWHGKPLYEAIVEMLRKEGFSGVTVLRGVAGYGGSSIYHTAKILRLSQDLPIILGIVETTQRIQQILPRLGAIGGSGLVTLQEGRVLLYPAAT